MNLYVKWSYLPESRNVMRVDASSEELVDWKFSVIEIAWLTPSANAVTTAVLLGVRSYPYRVVCDNANVIHDDAMRNLRANVIYRSVRHPRAPQFLIALHTLAV
jgi:hypothetical protein